LAGFPIPPSWIKREGRREEGKDGKKWKGRNDKEGSANPLNISPGCHKSRERQGVIGACERDKE